jgi:predicted DNA-binding helix-hairpin-helix protein
MNIVDGRLQRKLEILADAAKYDASCASSGAKGRNSRDGKGLGSTPTRRTVGAFRCSKSC